MLMVKAYDVMYDEFVDGWMEAFISFRFPSLNAVNVAIGHHFCKNL